MSECERERNKKAVWKNTLQNAVPSSHTTRRRKKAARKPKEDSAKARKLVSVENLTFHAVFVWRVSDLRDQR